METAKVRLVVHQSLQEVTARGGRVDDEDRFCDGTGRLSGLNTSETLSTSTSYMDKILDDQTNALTPDFSCRKHSQCPKGEWMRDLTDDHVSFHSLVHW